MQGKNQILGSDQIGDRDGRRKIDIQRGAEEEREEEGESRFIDIGR